VRCSGVVAFLFFSRSRNACVFARPFPTVLPQEMIDVSAQQKLRRDLDDDDDADKVVSRRGLAPSKRDRHEKHEQLSDLVCADV
jgi:hypothetical protein